MPNDRLTAALARSDLFLAYVGMETDLIFNKGIDLPGFASFPLLDTHEGREVLVRYYKDLVALGAAHDCGVILESPTWMANKDRAAPLGYLPEALARLDRDAIALIDQVRTTASRDNILLSANIGPRNDAYLPVTQMSAEEAMNYHSVQIANFAETKVDVISAYTLAYPAEAVGIVRAAQVYNLPVVISFTVETDGRLPTGLPLPEAIKAVDAATECYSAYFMINCAHPDHILGALDSGDWLHRLRGIVANASRCSHAELDQATALDEGDPAELGAQLAQIRRDFAAIKVLGGCCGTDMRHMFEIARAARMPSQ